MTTYSPRVEGLRIALVTNVDDPTKSGRVQIRFPWLDQGADSDSSPLAIWARVVSPAAGNGRGLFAFPEVDDEVIVGFEDGRIEFPYVLGSLWNGKDTPPEQIVDGKNDRRSLTSRSGHVVRLDDAQGKERIEILGKDETTKIVFDCAENSVTIEATGLLSLKGAKVEIVASDDVVIKGAAVEATASSDMVIKGAKVKIN